MKLRYAVLLSPVVLAATCLSPAIAEERVCRGTIVDKTLDNVRVPDGATCTLRRTKVKGTVKVETDATLRAEDVIVIGNVQGENARNVMVLDGSRVGGSVQVVQGRSATVSDSRINGNILYDENNGRVRVLQSRVGADVQAFQNTGGVEIRGNVIDGNLQCKANTPPPTGGNNVVHGNKEDQCRRL